MILTYHFDSHIVISLTVPFVLDQAYTTYLLRQNWRPRLRTVYTVCGTIDRRFKLSYSLARILVRERALKGFSERASLIHERCQRMYGGVERFKAVVDCSPNFDVLLSG
jgi:hypothetical protein